MMGEDVAMHFQMSQIAGSASESLTLATGGKHEGFWIFLAHPVNHIDLLQCLSDCIFVLSLTGNIGGPELGEE